MKKNSKKQTVLSLTTSLIIFLFLFSFLSCKKEPLAIETFTVVRGSISQTVTSSGYIDTSDTKNYALQMSGSTLYILSKGDTFQKGDKLVEVDNEKILIAITVNSLQYNVYNYEDMIQCTDFKHITLMYQLKQKNTLKEHSLKQKELWNFLILRNEPAYRNYQSVFY